MFKKIIKDIFSEEYNKFISFCKKHKIVTIIIIIIVAIIIFLIWILSLDSTTEQHIITTNNQSGGITAHTVNIGVDEERHVTEIDKQKLNSELKPFAKGAAKILIIYLLDDSESKKFAMQIRKYLYSEGWGIPKLISNIGDAPPKGEFNVHPPLTDDDVVVQITVGPQ